jgi:hypothetical protein
MFVWLPTPTMLKQNFAQIVALKKNTSHTIPRTIQMNISTLQKKFSMGNEEFEEIYERKFQYKQ